MISDTVFPIKGKYQEETMPIPSEKWKDRPFLYDVESLIIILALVFNCLHLADSHPLLSQIDCRTLNLFQLS